MEDAYAAALGGERADALVTDPPYCLLTRRRKPRRPARSARRAQDRPWARAAVRNRSRLRAVHAGMAASGSLSLAPGAPAGRVDQLPRQGTDLTVAQDLGSNCRRVRLAKAGHRARRERAAAARVRTARYSCASPLPPARARRSSASWCVAAGYDEDREAARWGSHPNHKPFSVLKRCWRGWTRPAARAGPVAGSGSIGAAALRLDARAACRGPDPAGPVRVSTTAAARRPSRSAAAAIDPFRRTGPARAGRPSTAQQRSSTLNGLWLGMAAHRAAFAVLVVSRSNAPGKRGGSPGRAAEAARAGIPAPFRTRAAAARSRRARCSASPRRTRRLVVAEVLRDRRRSVPCRGSWSTGQRSAPAQVRDCPRQPFLRERPVIADRFEPQHGPWSILRPACGSRRSPRLRRRVSRQ